MKRLLKNLFFFSLLSITVLFVLGYVVDNGLRKSKMQYFAVWNDIYSSRINADMVICGPSRAWQHFSPRILDSVLHINSYNLGIEGWFVPMQFARLKVYLQHNKKPKYIIQDVEHLTFSDRDDVLDYEQFLPYINDTILAKATSRYKGKFTMPERYLPAFKYNNHFSLIKEGILSYFGASKTANVLYKGYAGKPVEWDGWFERFKKAFPNGKKEEVNPYVISQWQEYLNFCKANDIKVIFVFGPVLHEALPYALNFNEMKGLLKKYAAQYDIPFLDYSDDSISYHKNLFYNHLHLNATGSELFSQKLAVDLKGIVK